MAPSTTTTKVNGLIVNFPSNCSNAIKSVRFSSFSQMWHIEYPSQDQRDKIWYTKQDQDRFQKQVIRDAIYCSQLLVNVHINKKHAITIMRHCVGLEHLISHDVFDHCKATTQAARKNHAGTVLEEQKRQRRCNVHSPVELAYVSSSSSEVDRKH